MLARHGMSKLAARGRDPQQPGSDSQGSSQADSRRRDNTRRLHSALGHRPLVFTMGVTLMLPIAGHFDLRRGINDRRHGDAQL